MIVLADGFTGAKSLGRGGRASLARVLGCPSARVESAPLGDLNDGRYRRMLGVAVEAALEPAEVLSALSGTALADLFPGATLLPDGAVDVSRFPARLFSVLRGNDSDTWSTLLERTVSDVIGWRNIGPRTISQLFGVLFERSLAGLMKTRRPDRAVGDLIAVLEYEDRQGTVALRAALGHLATGEHPDPVKRSAQRLLHSYEEASAGNAVVLAEVLAGIIEASGSARDQMVFAARELTTFDRPSVDQLARRLRVSRERIRQLLRRSCMRVRNAGAGAPKSVQRLVTAVRDGLGAVAPVDDVPRFLSEVAPGPLDAASEQLLTWLAGPYRAVPLGGGWLATEPDLLVAQTRLALSQDGGARLAVEIKDELAVLGVVERYRDAWLAAVGVVAVDDMVVSTDGTTAATLERLLFATGRPMSVAEIESLAPAGSGAADKLWVTLRRDRRFVGSGGRSDTFELAEWRSTPRSPRSAGSTGSSRPRTHAPDAGSSPVMDRGYRLRVSIDARLLAGAEHPAPADLAEALGVAPDQQRVFAGRYGPVSVLNDCGQTVLVSLRPVALAAGAGIGDSLILGFQPEAVSQ